MEISGRCVYARESGKATRWAGQFRWRNSAGDAWHRKAVVLRDPHGEYVPAPTASRPARGKREAERALDTYIEDFAREAASREDNRSNAGAEMTVPEFVEEYIRTVALGNTQTGKPATRNTVSGYRVTNEKHIARYFADTRLRDLDARAIEAMKYDLAARAQAGERLGLSTRKKVYTLLHTAVKWAVRTDVLPTDPFAKVSRGIPAPPPNPHPLARESWKRLCALLDAMPVTPFRVSVELALQAGLREGECCGLRWMDVDFERHALHVRKKISRHDGLSDTKTRAGLRDIPMTDDLERLLEHRRLALEDFAPGSFVTGDASGPWNPEMLGKAWRAYAAANDLKDVHGKHATFHGLRDTFVTYALEATSQIEAVSRLAGHASAAFTLDVYGASMPDRERDVIRESAGSLRAGV